MGHDPAQLLAAWSAVLLRQSLYATIVFAVVAALLLLLRPRDPGLRAALWALVLLRLVLPPGIAHPFALGALSGRLGAAWAPAQATGQAAGADLPATPAAARSEAAPAGAGAPTWQSALGACWLLGAAVLGLDQLRRRRRVQRALVEARSTTDGALRELAESWRRRLRVRRPVRLVSSAAPLGPFTTGVLRPVIFLPATVAGDRRVREAVIAHEMAHVARLDALWLGLQQLLQVVYAFHPLVHLTAARLVDERERLCDAAVLAAGGIAPRAYAASLLDVLGRGLATVGAPTLSADQRRFSMRLHSILGFEPERRPRAAAALAAALAVGIFALPLASVSPAASAGATVAVPPPPAHAAVVELANPVPGGRVSWGWGPGRDPFDGAEVFHRGVDVAAAAGTPVRAPASGTVAVAATSYEPSPASGTVLVIDHGSGLSTFLAHLGTLAVEKGEVVAAGQVVATVGSTGRSSGPHVHLEVHRDGEPVDPAVFVREWRRQRG
jgi:murein DD-endopeptidase MepM/ murein hydrolase activator NlpD